MFWLQSNLGQSEWQANVVSLLEARLLHLLNHEIELQKKLEKDLDADVPEGLQTWTLSDLNSI